MTDLNYLLHEYAPSDDLERRDLKSFREFVAKYPDAVFERAPGRPVVTASAIVVNPDFSKILVMHHKLHGFYKQFGGHADGGSDLLGVAVAELSEESGARGRALSPRPIDIIRWNFPEMTKNGVFYPAHDCFDVAFLFSMRESTILRPNKKEVLDTKWELLEIWRDYADFKNPVYASNPQNIDYQRRIYNKVKAYSH
ncbi:MAG: hypothetical protein LBJ73_01535 [Rickettsiales bacterium]|jgi:hypothetical protein|nr:hypothetical protein [Rickettsiales bacterium]